MDINLGNTVPIFAHDVAMSTITKAVKTKDGKMKKENFTELMFIDSVRKSAIARIILPQSTLEELPQMITEGLKKIKKETKSKDVPEEKIEKTEIKTTSGYVG